MKNLLLRITITLITLITTLFLVSCDEETKSANESAGTIVGYWVGDVPASNPDDLALRYDHRLYYIFNSDGTLYVMTTYYSFQPSTEVYDPIAVAPYDIQVPSGKACQELDRILRIGTYTIEGDKLKLFFNKEAMFAGWQGTWEKTYNSSTSQPFSDDGYITFTLNGNTLELTSDDWNYTHYHYHHVFVGNLNRLSTAPAIPGESIFD